MPPDFSQWMRRDEKRIGSDVQAHTRLIVLRNHVDVDCSVLGNPVFWMCNLFCRCVLFDRVVVIRTTVCMLFGWVLILLSAVSQFWLVPSPFEVLGVVECAVSMHRWWLLLVVSSIPYLASLCAGCVILFCVDSDMCVPLWNRVCCTLLALVLVLRTADY